MARIDLNAKRAARSEAENEPHEVILGFNDDGTEQIFKLKPRMPLDFTDLLVTGRMGEAMRLLLVDPDDWERMHKAEPEEDDLLAVAEVYGVELPESPGSERSSQNGGPSLRRTSSGSTASTSRKRAGGRKPSAPAGSTP
jgi:hypothetical protein